MGYLQLYACEWIMQPATPYIDVYNSMTAPTHYAAIGQAPFAQLPPEDIALLDADPALRSRYCELVVTVLLPSLRRMTEIFGTKSHLNESIAPTRLDSLMPGIGRDWTSFMGSLTNTFLLLRVYAAQFESLVARWEQERFDLMQPDSPGSNMVLMFLILEQLKDVAKKEVELVGVSSGSRAAAGSNDFVRGGVAPVDEQKMET